VTTLAVFFWLIFCMFVLLLLAAAALLVGLYAVARLIQNLCTRIRSRRAPSGRPYLL
jgi:heme/copper-type cytochrome/quinol oxidase subunit 1